MTTDTNKRALLRLAAAGALAAAALAGCGKKDEAPAAAPTPAPAPAPAAAAPAEPLKAAWIYVGPVGSAGWSYAHDLGRKAVEAEFGAKVQTTFVESVPEGADTERVLRDLVAQGNKLIFGTSFGFMEPMLKVAQDHPDVKFEHATGYKTAANMNVYDSRFYQDTYLAGIVAASMSKTGALGFVGSFPIPEVLRNIDAFTLGAQTVNPKIKVRVVWVNTWYDPPKETEAAQALMNGGADVLLQNTDSTAVLQAAEKAGKFAFGWDSDMSAFGGSAHLGSAIADWSHYYKKTIQAALDGSWKGGQVTRWGVPEGQNDLIKLSDKIPADIQAKVSEIKGKMKDGSFDVFTGPVVDNAGKERLAAGTRADDDWMGKIDFFVKGVEGQIPASK
ncbi:MAG: BMP family ABC transporter substrate-binding protein [Ottowia sp.]|uniref:BMP family ABC transporter substrate-binding protein n=1 Tax=Ottowia sp. TaxID=1898956 RepID=UPI0039E5DB4D